jgi:hypothetical protein
VCPASSSHLALGHASFAVLRVQSDPLAIAHGGVGVKALLTKGFTSICHIIGLCVYLKHAELKLGFYLVMCHI